MTKHHLSRKRLRALARERLRQRLRTGLYAPITAGVQEPRVEASQHFRASVIARARRDGRFRAALEREAHSLLVSGDWEAGMLILEDIEKAGVMSAAQCD